MSRRLAREAAFKALFQVDVGRAQPGAAMKYALDGLVLSPEEIAFAGDLFSGTLKNRSKIDDCITPCLVNWTLDRIASVDRSLLRMAVYEIIYRPDIPPSVSIDEALELTHKYGEKTSVAFLNGVLDRVASKFQSSNRDT